MSYLSIVKGNVTKTTGGKHTMYAKNITSDASEISQTGVKRGISFDKNPSFPQPKLIASYELGADKELVADLAYLSMDVMYRDRGIKTGQLFDRTSEPGNRWLLRKIYKSTLLGFRCFVFRTHIEGNEVHAVVFMGTRPNNVYSLTSNITQGARIDSQVIKAESIGVEYRNKNNVIFVGHSKGGREAAFAARAHGYATVYSFNTSIAYLDDPSAYGGVDKYRNRGGKMFHLTTPGEMLESNGLNGHNGGFLPLYMYGDDVRWVDERVTKGRHAGRIIRRGWYHSNGSGTDQVGRHSDYNLMKKGIYNSFDGIARRE